ncbi:hypothetical protein [uncultured Erythrobacter sp.]|uniref:hypothetical protein n=1 Tax=uncultured Erythrobacter sp. TaxID=263913 RepID=UPI0026235B4D|nr:hypothetical protein [uncultured Erythrobacter sp.]
MPETVAYSDPVAVSQERRRGWLWLVALGVVLAGLRGATLLFDHSLHSIDGAMQTWFALDNFADGAKLGDEFQSYLGITMILSLLPGFVVLGETLWASTFAAYSMVIAGSFAGAYGIVWMVRPVPKSQRWMWAILLICGFYYAASLAAELLNHPYPATFEPGVSLRPLRGALPFFMLPAFVWSIRRVLVTGSPVPTFWLGVVAGLGLLWSNDAGIPLVIASLASFFLAFYRQWGLLIKAILTFIAGVAVSAFALVMAVTHSDPSGWWQYNFTDVAGDQFWYFGPWSRESRVLGITDLPQIFLGGQLLSTLSLIVLTTCVICSVFRRLKGRGSHVRGSAFVFVGASIVGTAVLPQIGGHIGSEYNAITFVLGFCAPIIVFQKALFSRAKPLMRRLPKLALTAAAAIAALAMIAIDAGSLVSNAQGTDRTVFHEKLGFYVTPKAAEDLAAIKRFSSELEERGFPEDQRLLSVYTSALDIAADVESPSPVGSLIHALGEQNRMAFNELLFSKAVAVTTIAPEYSGWAEWNTRANWSFFRNVRDLYRPVARSDQHILWIRSGGNPRAQDVECQVADWRFDGFDVVIKSPKTGVASLFFDREGFDASSRSALLTVTEDSPFTRSATEPHWSDFPRYGIANSRIVEVSAPVEAGEATRLTFNVMDGSAIGWAECFARVYEPIEFDALPSLSEGVDQLIAEAETGA